MSDPFIVKQNIQKMLSQGASAEEIDNYVSLEGQSPESIRLAQAPNIEGKSPEINISRFASPVNMGASFANQAETIPSAANRASIRANPALALIAPFANLLASSGLAGQQAQEANQQAVMNPEAVPSFRSELEPKFRNLLQLDNPLVKRVLDTAMNATGNPMLSTMNPANLPKQAYEATMSLPDTAASPFQSLLALGGEGLSKIPEASVAGKKLLGAVEKAPELGISKVESMVTPKPIEMQIKKEVVSGIKTGIRPSVAGKKTVGGVNKYYQNAVDGVKYIVENKDNLKYTDADGLERTGLPKSTADYAKAIEQSRNKIYKQYTELATKAGEKGKGFDVKSIINKATKDIVENKSYSPDARKYASEQLNKLAELEGADPLTVQARIEELNSSLSNYYRGATTKINSDIDATLAFHMRESLDKLIQSATGEQYAPLKRLYGALKALERDVNNRAIVYGRKAPSGLLDGATNLYTGEKIASALFNVATGNIGGAVAEVGKGALAQGINVFRNKIISPDRTVSSMFSRVEGLMAKIPKPKEVIKPTVELPKVPKALPAPYKARTAGTPYTGGQFEGVMLDPKQAEALRSSPEFKNLIPPKREIPIPQTKQLGVTQKAGEGFIRLTKQEAEILRNSPAFKKLSVEQRKLLMKPGNERARLAIIEAEKGRLKQQALQMKPVRGKFVYG